MKAPAPRDPAGPPDLPDGVAVQEMPRAPATPPEAAAPAPAPGDAPSPAEHPLAVHHERVSAAHEAFLRGQEEVQRGFIEHRSRLLEGLQQLWSVPFARAPGFGPPVEAFAEARPPVEPAFERVRRLERSESSDDTPESAAPELAVSARMELGWDDWFLDAHVAPVGVLLEPIGRLLPRALGECECEVEFFAGLPVVGETVAWATGAEGDAFAVDVSVGERRIARVAGRRIATWAPSSVDRARGPGASGLPAPATWTSKVDFTEREVAALLDGDPFGCFGEGFERSASHTRSPALPGARLIRLARVQGLDPTGGPLRAGALRARVAPAFEALPARQDPGLRLARVHQGALQCLAFFAAAAGATIERDGWRFEPLVGQASRVRFAEAPDPEQGLDYEVALERLEIGQDTVVVGDVRALVGDRVVFEGERLGLRLVPDWPLTSDRALMADGAAVDRGPRR
ncbi:MAG TPA: hypothetical protein VKU41_00440, partial [Polyangiaceae bacterium]|nr:hypothetical protein [Polyangiaceae bacterium]